VGEQTPKSLLDDFASCESWSDGIDFDLHVVTRFGLWDENYETFDPCDAVTATANLFDVKLVLLALLNRLVEGTLKAHVFHLVSFVQLVLREKTQTPTRIVTVRRSLQPVYLTHQHLEDEP
jgi:hypothetical protein